MNWFSQYSLFLAETATVVIAILAVLIFILSQRRKSLTAGRLSVKDISHEYEQVKDDMLMSSLDEVEAKQFNKELKKQKKLEKLYQKYIEVSIY